MVSCATLQWTLRTFAESFSSNSLPNFSYVSYQWRGNSVMVNMFYFYHMKRFMCWTIYFTDETYFHFNGCIHCQKIVYGVLKTQVHSMETHCIRPRLVFDALCSENGRDNRCEILSTFFTPFRCSAGRVQTGLLASTSWGDRPYCENNNFFAGHFRLSYRLSWPLAPTIPSPYAT